MKRLPDTELEVMKALWAWEGQSATRSELEHALGHQHLQHLPLPPDREGLCLLRKTGQDQLVHAPGVPGRLPLL